MAANGSAQNSTAPADRDVERADALCTADSSTASGASGITVVAIEEDAHPDAPIAEVPPEPIQELEEEDNSPPTPRFIQEEGAWKRWKWVPYSIRRFTRAAVKWAKGPPGPQDYRIEPLLPAVQHAPLWLMHKYVPKRVHRLGLAFVYLAVWLVTFALVMRQGLTATEIEGWGTPVTIGCGNTYWVSGNGCGLDGNDCRPFNNSGFAFKCPASCASYQVLNYRAVGTQEIVYQPLVIGGPPAGGSAADAYYRGDSFICGAAVHAGVVSNSKGGCGVVHLIGEQSNFASSKRFDITSVGFDSYFPLAFAFDNGVDCSSRDMRWPLLAVSVVFTTVLSLFTTSPSLFFFGNFVMIFWTVGMATDAPHISDIPSLFSNELGNFLPAMFTAWVMFDKMGVRRALTGLTAQVEKTVLWLGGCWVGALTNYTFDFIPIQRLTAHDLNQQPGAQAALAIIVIVLFVIFCTQVFYFRQEGRLIKYLKLYALFIAGIIICLLLPSLSLRIHHYILALLLLPGTSLQTRPSLLYQGILVGLFIDGIARWGWDAFLQTSEALLGDAQLDSPLPTILQPVITALGANLSTITFQWDASPGPEYDGISVLVNDVERFRTYFDDAHDAKPNFTWSRTAALNENEYFRFAWMSGSSSQDYTKAGTWDVNRTWVEMEAGASKVKARSLEGVGEEDRMRVRNGKR